MNNEPQLSAEMEQELITEIDILLHEYKQDGDESRVANVLELAETFLATALEEQRIEYVRRVEELKWNHKVASGMTSTRKYDLALDYVLAILQQKDV